MNTFVFSSKEELLAKVKKDGACKEGLDWAKKQDSLETILKEIPLDYRLWCLGKGYSQFSDRCPWEQLDGFTLSYLLYKQPQFSDRCSWEKLNGFHWTDLLSKQPQFSYRCPWERLNGIAWAYLLSEQPQFSDRCSWEKLNGIAWAYLLSEQPQLKKFMRGV